MTEVATRPLPARDDLSPYWTNAAEGRLSVQCCAACGNLQHPPAPICYRCHGEQLGWQEVPPHGVIHSLSVMEQARVRGFESLIPLAIAVVELDAQEGLLIFGNLFGAYGRSARIGDRVEVWFEKIDARLSLPQFRLRPGAEESPA